MDSDLNVPSGSAAPLDQTLFASDLVQVGRFRCSSRDAGFETAASPTRTHCFVFPRTAVWIEHEDRGSFLADPNTIPVYNAGRAYRRRSVRGGDDRSDWFGIAPDVLRDIIADHDGRAAEAELPFRFAWTRAAADVYLTQRNIFRYLSAQPGADALYVEEAVINLATALVGEAYRRGLANADRTDAGKCRRLVERTQEHLATSFARRAGLSALARDVGASVFRLCRIFKAHTGSTIHQYRTQLRIRHSLELLEHNSGDILSVALRAGFSGHSHYTRTFQTLAGMSPSQFAKGPRPAFEARNS